MPIVYERISFALVHHKWKKEWSWSSSSWVVVVVVFVNILFSYSRKRHFIYYASLAENYYSFVFFLFNVKKYSGIFLRSILFFEKMIESIREEEIDCLWVLIYVWMHYIYYVISSKLSSFLFLSKMQEKLVFRLCDRLRLRLRWWWTERTSWRK